MAARLGAAGNETFAVARPDALHNLGDYSAYMPSLLWIAAVLCGLVWRPAGESIPRSGGDGTRIMHAAGLAVIVLAALVAEPVGALRIAVVGAIRYHSDLGQQGVVKDLGAAIADLGQDKKEHTHQHVAPLDEKEQRGKEAGLDGEKGQEALLGPGKVGHRAQDLPPLARRDQETEAVHLAAHVGGIDPDVDRRGVLAGVLTGPGVGARIGVGARVGVCARIGVSARVGILTGRAVRAGVIAGRVVNAATEAPLRAAACRAGLSSRRRSWRNQTMTGAGIAWNDPLRPSLILRK